jgi:hypothetical protein
MRWLFILKRGELMLALNPIKRGDTFSFYANFKDTVTNTPLTGVASNLRSQCRNKKGELLFSFTITESTTPGKYYFISPNTSLLIPNQILYVDIEYSNGANVLSSDTFTVKVEEDITR